MQGLNENNRRWRVFDGLSIKDKRRMLMDLVQSEGFEKLGDGEYLDLFFAFSSVLTIPPQWHSVFFPSPRIYSFKKERVKRMSVNSLADFGGDGGINL